MSAPHRNPPCPRARLATSALPLCAGLLLVCGLAACGGGATPASSTAAAAAPGGVPRGGGRRGFARDPKVQACLKRAGITLPAFGRGRRGGPGGGPGGVPGGPAPDGTTTQPPPAANRPPPGVRPQNAAAFQKLRAALQKCAIQLPDRGPGGGPGAGGGPAGAAQTVPGATS